MAAELGQYGILVNAVIPGATMTAECIARDVSRRAISLGRWLARTGNGSDRAAPLRTSGVSSRPPQLFNRGRGISKWILNVQHREILYVRVVSVHL
jgi:NAD(P)-dependent dehydrogenase (short-subunit alcohol dehydrogenase family)